MLNRQAVEVEERVRGMIAPNVSLHARDDISQDVMEQIIRGGMPQDLQRMVNAFAEKQVNAFVRRSNQAELDNMSYEDRVAYLHKHGHENLIIEVD